jgi:hypothetical protein
MSIKHTQAFFFINIIGSSLAWFVSKKKNTQAVAYKYN